MPPKVLLQEDEQSTPENTSILELLNTLLQRQDSGMK